MIGYLPLTTAVAYLGARAQTLSTSDPLLWIAVAVLVVLLASERLFRRRMRRERRATEGPQAARSDLNNEAAPRGDAPGC